MTHSATFFYAIVGGALVMCLVVLAGMVVRKWLNALIHSGASGSGVSRSSTAASHAGRTTTEGGRR